MCLTGVCQCTFEFIQHEEEENQDKIEKHNVGF